MRGGGSAAACACRANKRPMLRERGAPSCPDYIAYFVVHSRAVVSCRDLSVRRICAISGTSGSSGFGSVSNEQIESSTLEIVRAGDHWSCGGRTHGTGRQDARNKTTGRTEQGDDEHKDVDECCFVVVQWVDCALRAVVPPSFVKPR